MSKCYLTTFMIYNSSIYDYFINMLYYPEDKLNKIDMIIYYKFVCIIPYPLLVWQIDSYSNICKRYRDDMQVIKNNTDTIFKKLKKNFKKLKKKKNLIFSHTFIVLFYRFFSSFFIINNRA
jgi:hypothetical protein